MSVTWIRLTAALLPATLLLHEGAYALSAVPRGDSHAYLELALPLLVAFAGVLALASLLLPLIGAGREARVAPLTPFAVAGGLVAVFAAQELAEALLFGGGASALAAALASAWLLLPLALLLGLLTTAAIEALDRTGELLLAVRRREGPRSRSSGRSRERAGLSDAFVIGSSPLAFGLARRPPPSAPARS
jgi:hypothetical protein